MQFEWDKAKEKVNLAKHGVAFAEAKQVFDDPRLVIDKDEVHSSVECAIMLME